MNHKSEVLPQVDLRLDGRKAVRGDVVNDWGSRLQWVVKRNGETIATPGARGATTYEHAEQTPGKYEIALQMWRYDGFKAGSQGQYVDVSGTVSYTI